MHCNGMFQAATFLLISGCCGNCCPEPAETGLDTAAVIVDSDSGGGAGGDDSDSGTDEGGGVHGTISGTVAVVLYETDEDENLVLLEWADTCFGDVFPYGSIFVAAYTTDEETGVETYYAEDVIVAPQVDSSLNTYTLEVDTDVVDEVQVYAVLDKWSDAIIGSQDPVGIYADAIALSEGEERGDVDIDIVTPYWCGGCCCPDCPPNWGDGSCLYWDGTQWVSTCGGECDTLSIAGPVDVDAPWNTGTAAAMLMEPTTGNPYYTHTGIGLTGRDCDGEGCEGADGDYAFTLCQLAYTWDLRGCWDSNGNGMYDPDDTWGQVVDATGAPAGTIAVDYADVLDQTILIPVEGSEIDIVPYVRLSGDLHMAEGDFDDLLADYPEAHVYVTLLKYFPNGDLEASALESAYDYQVFGPDELAGQSSVAYDLMAPGNATVYLWATADVDNDEVLNESEDPVGCAAETCLLSTGTTSQSGLSIGLESVSQTEE